jgi:hypothetical protein
MLVYDQQMDMAVGKSKRQQYCGTGSQVAGDPDIIDRMREKTLK